MPPCPDARMFRPVLWVIAFYGLTAQACGGVQTAAEPPETATTRTAQYRVHRAVGRAANTQTVESAFQTWIRFNPAPCDCPRWELQMYGHWERVQPVGARDADANVSGTLAFEGFSPGELLWADVVLTDDTVVDGQGWVYPVYNVRRISEDPDS